MKGLVFKFKGVLIARDLEDIREDFKNQLEHNGFIVVDDRYDIFEINDDDDKGAVLND